MNRRHDDREFGLAQALTVPLALVVIFLIIGTLDAADQQQIGEAAANPQAHGAEWNSAAQTWDYPEARSYEF